MSSPERAAVTIWARELSSPCIVSDAGADAGQSSSKCVNTFALLVSTHLDCLLGLYWTGLTLLNGFSFLVIFFFFILGRAVD